MRKIIDVLHRIQLIIGTICLSIFLVTVVWQIFTRLIGVSALWTEDVSIYSFIWSVFMGASALVRDRAHFAFSSLVDGMQNPRKKAYLRIGISTAMIFFSAGILYYGIVVSAKFWNHQWVGIPSLKRGPVWLCLPISGGLSIVYLIELIVADARTFLLKRPA
jgi:TRAP-type C4-dicarboxylate transport system permease small subunit